MADHVLFLLRHATAEDYVPGGRDAERPLSARGRRQAAHLGAALRDTTVDLVLCSPALRTRQTAEGLALACPVSHVPAIYDAGSDTILAELAVLPEDVTTALVVGHAPGIPALARELGDPATSDPDALAQLEIGYPPATLTRLELDRPWAELATHSAAVTGVRRG